MKPRPPSHKNDASDRQPVPSYHNNHRKGFGAKHVYKNKERCQNLVILHIQKVSSVQQKVPVQVLSQVWTFTSLCYQKKQVSSKPTKPKAHMLQAGVVYACDKSICSHPEDLSSSNVSFCLQVKI